MLAGDNFIPEMQLKQPVFRYSACGPFTKNKEEKKNKRIKRNKEKKTRKI